MTIHRVVRAGLWLVLGFGLFSGCGPQGPERVRVSGRVLIDGKPVEHGFVQFVPTDARPATGQLGPDGRFTLTSANPNDGIVRGTHRVAVMAVESIDGSGQRWHAPKKYADLTTSGLIQEIQESTDSLVIELTWAGGEPFVESFDPE